MSRIANAWRALTGAEAEAVEYEIEVEVVANVESVDVYRLSSNRSGVMIAYSEELYARLKTYHLTCEEAFKSIPEKDRNWLSVESRKAIRIGNRYFSADAELKVAKPKRAKGAK